jgi:hypothetical protein
MSTCPPSGERSRRINCFHHHPYVSSPVATPARDAPRVLASPVDGAAGATQATTNACRASMIVDSALATISTATGCRVATPASSTGATNSTTLAISSTAPGVGQAPHGLTEFGRSLRTGIRVSATTGSTEVPISHHAHRGRLATHAPTSGPRTTSRPNAMVVSHGWSMTTAVIMRSASHSIRTTSC